VIVELERKTGTQRYLGMPDAIVRDSVWYGEPKSPVESDRGIEVPAYDVELIEDRWRVGHWIAP